MRPADGARRLLTETFLAAVRDVVDPERIYQSLPETAALGRTVVVGGGKAAATMAAACEMRLSDVTGLVVTRNGYGRPTKRIEVVEAGHPVPTLIGMTAAGRILDIAHGLTQGDRMICLISGGASALLTLPVAGVSLNEKQLLTTQLLRSGAAIEEINLVRRHLSLLKGGRLAAAAWPAECHTIVVSDVVGDQLLSIGSGPTVFDPSSPEDAAAILQKYQIDAAASINLHLGVDNSSLRPDHDRFDRCEYRLAARSRDALSAAAKFLGAAGYSVVDLGDALTGDAAAVARYHADLARQMRDEGRRIAIISGGELTVTLGATRGFGGPNQEYALSAASHLRGLPGVTILSADTDGCDGISVDGTDIAGAIVDSETLSRCMALGLDPAAALERHDAGSVLRATGDAFVTGPTGTNVNDLRIILVDPCGDHPPQRR